MPKPIHAGSGMGRGCIRAAAMTTILCRPKANRVVPSSSPSSLRLEDGDDAGSAFEGSLEGREDFDTSEGAFAACCCWLCPRGSCRTNLGRLELRRNVLIWEAAHGAGRLVVQSRCRGCMRSSHCWFGVGGEVWASMVPFLDEEEGCSICEIRRRRRSCSRRRRSSTLGYRRTGATF